MPSKLPRTNKPCLTLEDENGNTVRIVDFEGTIYIESMGRHRGDIVHTLVKIDRLRFIPMLLGWFQ